MESLIIHSVPALSDLISAYMESKGWSTLSPSHDRDLIQVTLEEGPGAVIVDADILQRGRNVWDLVRRLRERSDVPLIVIAGQGSEQDAVRALRLGADDYVRKPFGLAELEARLHTAQKRLLKTRDGSGGQDILYSDDNLTVEPACQRVYRRGRQVYLSPTESRLLAYLINHLSRVVPHDELLRHVWGESYGGDRGCLSLYIRYLRTKIEDDAAHPRYITTKRGAGYRFMPAPCFNRN